MKTKKRMIRAFIAVCLAAWLFPSAVLCDLTGWDCPTCGRTGNTGNYCGGCGLSVQTALQETISALTQELNSARVDAQQLRDSLTGKVASLEATLAEQQIQADILKESLNAANNEKETFQAALAAVEKELDELRREAETLKAEKQAAVEAQAALQAKLEAAEKALANALSDAQSMTTSTTNTVSASGKFIPGTYEAVAKGFGGDVKVTVTVDENAITTIEIIGEDEVPALGGVAISMMAEGYVGKDDANAVDGMSGASVTSAAVKKAVAEALAAAKK